MALAIRMPMATPIASARTTLSMIYSDASTGEDPTAGISLPLSG